MLKHLKEVIFILIAAALGFAGGLYFEYKSNAVKYLEWGTHSIKDFSSQIARSSGTDSISIFVGNKKVNDITLFHIYVANTSDINLSDILIYIELFHKNGEPVKIINNTAYDQNGLKESISRHLENLQPTKKNGQRFAYTVKTLNKSEDFKGSIYFSYAIEGTEEPSFKIHTDKSGIDIKESKMTSLEKFTYSNIDFLFGGLVALVACFILGYFDDKWVRRQYRIRLKQYRDTILKEKV